MTQSRRKFRIVSMAAASIVLSAMMVPHGQAAAEVASDPCSGRLTTGIVSDHANAPTFGGGCVNKNNIENMVQQKSDLTQGRPLGPANAEREAQAVKRYEEGKVKTESDYKGTSPVSIFGGSSSSGGGQSSSSSSGEQ